LFETIDFSKRDGAAVLDTVAKGKVPGGARATGRTSGSSTVRAASRADLAEDFAPRRRSFAPSRITEDDEPQDFTPRRRLGGLRFSLPGGIPRSVLGRVMAGLGVVAALGVTLGCAWEARAMLLSNPRLVLDSSADIEVSGNKHLTRAQLLTVFGEDVERNILTVSLAARRTELEQLPWVEHATVMRLLPNRFRVAIVERKPVAFVRQGGRIGLVDANGVLLDMASDGDTPDSASAAPSYSFPVVTGIGADDPLSTRVPRMKLFTRFMTELGDRTRGVSEVDLSNPEDVKALIQDNSSSILVHFGAEDFARRFDLYQKNLPGWKREFPHLGSADMRYERQVVLEMQPGAAVPVAGAASDVAATPTGLPVAAKSNDATSAKPAAKAAPKAVPKPSAKPVAKPAAKTAAKTAAKPKPGAHAVATKAAAKPAVPADTAVPVQHLTQAFDAPAKKAHAAAATGAAAKAGAR
jgi:cell division protein FtsQ